MEVNNTRKLYDALKSDGYTDLGDFSSFEGKLKDSGKREMLYDVLKKDGWQDLGDFSQFESKLGYAPINNENIKETDYVSQSSVNPPPISLRQEVDIPKSDQSEYVNPWDNSANYNFESLRKKEKIETSTPPPPTEYEKDSPIMNTWAGDAIQKLNAGGADLGAGIFGVLDKAAKGLESATGGLIPRGGAFKDISDIFKADAEFSRARSNRYNGKDFTDLWKEGNYMGAIGDIALQGVESLPMSIGAMAATMAGAPAAGLAGIGSIVASQKYDDLDQNNPNMGEFAKVSNAILTGTAESLSEMLGAGVSKAWMSTLFKTLGKEKAQEAIKRGIMGKMQEFYKKFGMFFEPVNEGIEEVSSTLAENITDKITGADPERDLTDGVLQSFVYGMGGGAYFTGAGALAKGAQYVADKIGGKQAQQPITDSNVTDQGVETPPLLTKSRFAEAEEQGRNMTDPGDIRTASKKMEETRLSLSEMVPGLVSTIESYVDDGASEAQVMSLLDGVNADARPLAEDFYADYLRISGLQDRIGEEIDNEVETYVANNITPYVTTNPDGQSIVTTATLSDGNVERPVYIRSIEGDKAVISDNGQDRMVSVKRLSDIVEQDAGHMRRTYEDQLLATRQSELDMTMHHNPKTQLPKPGLIIWNGDNAFILQGQDENGDWIAQPAAYDRETGQVTAKNGSSPAMPITENEILDLQDAIYDAQQVNVVSPEDDSVASADAEITSAPPVEDAINQPTSEIETEGAIDQIAQPSNVENPSMVMREDGTPDFVSSGTDMALDFLYDKYGDKMPRKIEVTRKSFDESLKKASDALEKAQEAYDDAPIGKEDKAEAALIKARQEYEAIKVEADFWANLDNRLKEESEKATATLGQVIDISEKEDTEPVDIKNEDVVTQEGASGEVKESGSNLFNYFTGSLSDLIEQAKKSAGKLIKKIVAPVSDRLRNDLEIKGVSITSDYNHVIDNNAIRHTLKQHGGNSEIKRGQVPVNDSDFDKISDIVENYDDIKVEDGKRGDVNIIYSKNFNDGTTIFVEEKRDKRKGLAAVTMWKMKNPILTGANSDNATPIPDLNRIKRQAEREGGELLILTPKGAAASLSTLPDNSSSTDKGSISSSENQANEVKSFVAPSPKESENPLDYAERIVEAKRLHDEELKVDTTPSEAQKEAGNYKKGHIKINGFDVTIEQPAGSVRSGKDASGKEWSQVMNNTYGYIRGTESVDGDHIDVFLGPDMNSDMVYVVDQVNTDGSFDEHKVMMGFSSLEDARSAYLSNYEEGWQGLGNITGVALDEFKKWIDSSIRKTKPFSEYKGIKREEDIAPRKVKKLSLVDKDDYITSAERKHIKAFLESGLKEARVNNSIYEISNIGDDGVYEIVRRFNYTDPLTLVKDENGKLVNKRGEGEHVIRVKPTFEETRPDSGIRFRETRIIPEEENIIKKAKSDGSYMKAPNGNPTNLNEKQWVQVRTKAFKEWFGDWENNPEDASKVIDENGEPRVVYHGTYSDFNAFDESHLGNVTDLNATNEDWAKTSHIGFWFNDNKIGFYTKHKPVYLNVRNPLEFASMESLVDEMSYYDSGEDFKRSNSDGYDSVIVLEDEEMGGRSYVVFNDNQIKSATENNEDFSSHNDDIRFREVKDKNGEKSLVGLHNISEEKLLKALRQGGFANPSAAVIDISRQSHTGYGSISLVLPSSMIEKRTGKNAGTWSQDAWTPIYPTIERQFSGKGSDAFSKDLQKLPEEMRSTTKSGMDSYMDGRGEDSLAYMYLYEQGKAPEIARTKPSYPKKTRTEVEDATNGSFSMIGLSDKQLSRLKDAYMEYKGFSTEGYNEAIKLRRAKLEEAIGKMNPRSILYEKRKTDLERIDKYGFDYSAVESFMKSVRDDISNSDKVDAHGTMRDSWNFIEENGMRGDFNKWLDNLNERYGIKEIIFNGFTPSGIRKYIPNTLENVSKFMKKQGRSASVGIGASFQNFAASLLDAKGSLKDIRKDKGKLTTDHADVDAFRDKWSKVFYELGEKLQPDAKGYDDYGLYRLAEAARSKDPQKYIKKEYGIDFSDEDVKTLNEMVDAIRNEYPAMYFETKFERPVYLEEFAAAVVPDNVDGDIRKAIYDAGLKIFTYKADDEISRNEAVKQASEIDGVRFRSIGDKGAANLNKAETIESSINDWSNKLNTPVRVIHDVDDITDTDENMLARKRDSKGWYDTSTGEIVIVSPNSMSVGDAQRTFLHEVVGHHGLRELFGDDFDTFLDNVYRNANEDIRKNIIDRTKGNPLNLREATEEYLAELAERGFDNKADRSLWEKIKDAFLDMLRKAGISLDFKLSDNDLRYILWRSYKNLEQGNLMDVAEDIVMRNRLSLNNINLNENGSIARDIEPEKGKQPSETKGTGRELETIDGVDENGNESERDHIDKPRGVENAIDGTENATDRNGRETDGQVDNDGDQLDGGDTGDRSTGLGGVPSEERGNIVSQPDDSTEGRGDNGTTGTDRGAGGESGNVDPISERTDDFAFAERIKKENDNIRFREAKSEVENEEPLNKEMVDAWDKVASSDSFKFKEAMVDSLTAIDEFLKLLAKKTKSRILDYENPYFALIALSSKNKTDMDSFDSKFLNPLNEAIRALIGDASEVSKKGLRRTWDWSKGALRDLVKYVQAKHGIERNRDMSVRDGIETLKAFDVDALSKMGVISESDLKNAKKTAEKVAEEKGSEAYKKTYDKVIAKELKKGVDKEKAERSAEIAADYRKSLVKSEIYNKEMNKYKEKVTGTLIDRWEDSKKDVLNKDLAWDEEQKELDREALSFQWKLGDNSYGVILGKDYSGLSSVFKPSEDGANKDKWLSDAYDFVRDYESTHNMVLVDNLWDKVHNVSEYTLRRQYESGLISKSYMDKNLSRFKYFIPLRGFSDNIASDVYDYIDATEIKMGNPVKTAKGRISEADNPFAGLIHVGYGSITAGNRNLAKQRFLNLASNHDTGGLITIDNIWVRNVGTEENPEWVESIPQIPDNASGEEVAKAVKDHEEMMRELREEGKAELIKGGRSDIPYKTLYDQRSQHQVQVFVGGNRYVMTVNGNPRLAQAVNGLTNPDVKDDLAYVVARNLKTFMAGAFTSKNVAFSFANLIRDTPYANNSVFVTENFRYFKDFSGNQRRALFGLRSLGRNLYKYRRGEIDISDKEQAIFKEFMDNGGATGYTFVETQKEYAKDLANKLEKLSDGNIGKLSPKELVSTVFECFEFMGNVAELVNRYAAYKTSREHGRSIDRSINDAKEVSVNFNKKGAGKKTKSDKWYINTAAWISEYGRDWVLFFNAAVQSMYKEYSMLRNHPIKGISSRIAPLIFMGSSVSLLNNLFMPMLFAYLGWDSDDDDDRDYFDSLSDYERQNNICIRLTHGRWLKIPLSPELANYFKIGDIIAGQLSGKREVEAMDVVKTGIDMVSPLNINWEYDSWKFALNLLPTVVHPIAQNASNVNFMGNPIYKTSMNKTNDYDPEYTKVYRSTSTTMVELSRALNSLTGGDDVKRGTSFNPATWQNILSGYTGGFGTVALGVSDLVLDMLSGENGDMPVSRYPLLSRFLTGGDKDLKLSRMNSIYKKKVVGFVTEMNHDYKGYLKKIQDTSVDDFDRAGYMVKLNQLTGSDDYRRSMVLSQYVKAISDMERFLREVGSDNDSLENQLYELKLQALEIFEDSDE